MQADQESIVLLRDGTWARITQANDAYNLILIDGRLAFQELTCGLPQQLSA